MVNIVTPYRNRRIDGWTVASVIVALLVLAPILAVGWIAFFPTENIWPDLVNSVLPRYIKNTLILMVAVGAGAAILGTSLAYLVTHHRFIGRSWLQYALFLPLSIPSYVGAYALVDALEYAGPVQGFLRGLFGWQSGAEYWFFEIRSLGSAIFVLTLTLYPYVYLMARASFRSQPASGRDVAASLGLGALSLMQRVAMPLARPGIVAGTAIVMMETVNDFGTVEFFSVQTLTTGIFTTWLESYNAGGAAQIALCVLALIAILVGIERFSRQGAKFHSSARQVQTVAPQSMTRIGSGLACAFCTLVLLLGFVTPVMILLEASIGAKPWSDPAILRAIYHSTFLGVVTAAVVVIVAMGLTFGLRQSIQPWRQWLLRATTLGYAVPGAVLGIGVLIPLAMLDTAIADGILVVTGWDPGLLLTGGAFGLLFAYCVRFFAVAVGAAETGFSSVSPNVPLAARSLGLSKTAVLWRVFQPMMRGATGSAVLLVFVDTVKELPATLLLRPFNYDTLATYTYAQASLEDLSSAGPTALMIVALSGLAVIFLARTNR